MDLLCLVSLPFGASDDHLPNDPKHKLREKKIQFNKHLTPSNSTPDSYELARSSCHLEPMITVQMTQKQKEKRFNSQTSNTLLNAK
jgi:hypothetical protein